jgi:hypothetical protein
MKKKIFMFSRDPGGTNTIIPLVRPLRERGYEVILFGKDVALNICRQNGLEANDITEYVSGFGMAEIQEFIKKINPDCVITGTSIEDFTEKYLWKASEKLNIPSFAILDQWINYGIRFSKYGAYQSDIYRDDKVHPFLPMKILVMDDIAKHEAIQDGLEPSRIEITGQPYFETLMQKVDQITQNAIQGIRKQINVVEDDYVITFASEPVSVDYRGNIDGQAYWGYTEKTIFEELIKTIENVSNEFKKRITIVIKLHPREDKSSYLDEIKNKVNDSININIVDNVDSCSLIAASDLICGMSSMFLIEAVVIGKPVISITIGLNRENPFVLDRIGVLKSVHCTEELQEKLRLIMINNTFVRPELNLIKNPVERTIELLRSYI